MHIWIGFARSRSARRDETFPDAGSVPEKPDTVASTEFTRQHVSQRSALI